MTEPKKQANRVMPDSHYDLDANRAYQAIWRSTTEFHAMLKARTEEKRGNSPTLDLSHFEQAIEAVLSELYRRYRKRNRARVFRNIVAEALLVAGGVFLTPLLIDIGKWLANTHNPFAPDQTSVPSTVIGILLIIVKVFIALQE